MQTCNSFAIQPGRNCTHAAGADTAPAAAAAGALHRAAAVRGHGRSCPARSRGRDDAAGRCGDVSL